MHRKAPCCGDIEKTVVVSVYVERPRRRRLPFSPSGRQQRNHLHHQHLRVRERITYHKTNRGYDRRAELLHYAQHLREAARRLSAPGTPAGRSHTAATTSSSARKNEPQMNKILSVRRRSRKRPIPACLGDWRKVFIPGFLRSFAGFRWKRNKNKKSKGSPSDKIGAVVKSFKFQMKRRWGLVSKALLSKFQKGR